MSEVFYNAKNLIVSNGFIRNPNRYYLEEFFNQLPCSNNNIVTQATNHTTTTELNAPDGIITLALNNNQTDLLKSGRYVYDVEISFNDSNGDTVIERILEGKILVTPSVTK